MLITTTTELADFCRKARAGKTVYFDTEFVREASYWPSLELVQINTGEEIALVDFPSVSDMSPFWELMHDTAIQKVFHSGRQDLELLYQEGGVPVTETFDTQIAAAFVGYGEQVSYADLVGQITGVRLSKSQSYTPWNKRPLTQAQLAYAEDDVRYLPVVTDCLKQRLADLGRTEWVLEEFKCLELAASSGPIPSDKLYLRVRGIHVLDRKELAILRELAAWREQEAQRSNKPAQRILKDDALITIARKPPSCVGDLRHLRGFPPNIVEWVGPGIVKAVQRALSTPRDQWPEKLEFRQMDPALQPAVMLLQTMVRIRAIEAQMAWSLLTTVGELEELVGRWQAVQPEELPVLRGWRHELVGRDLLRMLRGEKSLCLDPNSYRAIVNTP